MSGRAQRSSSEPALSVICTKRRIMSSGTSDKLKGYVNEQAL
jgi:hypothetical protein